MNPHPKQNYLNGIIFCISCALAPLITIHQTQAQITIFSDEEGTSNSEKELDDFFSGIPLPPLFPEVETITRRATYKGMDPAVYGICTDYESFCLFCTESITNTSSPLKKLIKNFLNKLKPILLNHPNNPTTATTVYDLIIEALYTNPFIIRDTLEQFPRIFQKYHVSQSIVSTVVQKLSKKQQTFMFEDEILFELLRHLCKNLESEY